MSRNTEGAVIARVLIEATKQGWRLFRNSVGAAWVGRVTEECTLDAGGKPLHVIELAGARRVSFGLAVGSSDLVGWRPLVITKDMVGQTVAQFVSIECKTLGYKRTTEVQDNWLSQVAAQGGLAAIAMETEGGEVVIREIKNS